MHSGYSDILHRNLDVPGVSVSRKILQGKMNVPGSVKDQKKFSKNFRKKILLQGILIPPSGSGIFTAGVVFIFFSQDFWKNGVLA